MRCHSCRAPANVEIRRSRTAYCARCYPDWFRGQVQERIAHERMFRRDDRLLIAISGGKDSLALWHALTRLGYQADGMYIRLGIADYSRRSQAKSEAFAAAHGLTLHQVDLEEAQGFTVPDLLDARSGKPCAERKAVRAGESRSCLNYRAAHRRAGDCRRREARCREIRRCRRNRP